MSSNQVEILYMISKLKDWNQSLGGADSRRKLAGCQFDAWQQEFLIKRYQTQKLQNQKQNLGLNTKTASHGHNIRQGIENMQTALGKMRQENRKLTKKQADTPQNLKRRQKIIQNCQQLFQDIQQRQKAMNDPNGFSKPTKVVTLTDMRAKLLSDIEQQNYKLHQQDSEGHLTQTNEQQMQAMQKFKQKDIEMDGVLDEIIDGVQGITAKVKGINKKQDEVIQKTHKNKKKVQTVSKRIQTDNDKLKVIIQKFSKGRCCMTITLGLLFIGLIVVIIKMFVLG